MLNLEGKKVLLTGASGGIGSVIVEVLSKQGAIMGLSDRSQENLDALAARLPNKSHTFVADLSNPESVKGLYDKAEEEMGGVDILVCNAGITKDGLIMRMSDEDWDTVLNINLKSAFILNRAAVTKMMKRRWGRIINIASIVGVMGNPGQANYVASKSGLIGMTKSVAAEVASRGITANCIAPGFIATPMTEKLSDEQKANLNSKIPMGRMGTPLDIANGVAFLASNEAEYITGITLHINGGMVMV